MLETTKITFTNVKHFPIELPVLLNCNVGESISLPYEEFICERVPGVYVFPAISSITFQVTGLIESITNRIIIINKDNIHHIKTINVKLSNESLDDIKTNSDNARKAEALLNKDIMLE